MPHAHVSLVMVSTEKVFRSTKACTAMLSFGAAHACRVMNEAWRIGGAVRECFSEQGAQKAKQSRRRRAAKLTFSIAGLVSKRCHLWGGRA